MVCKHELELGEVLTAATPRLEQRFDADLKEDRILQAQHGGSQKLGFTRGNKFCMTHFTKPKHSTPLKENVHLSHLQLLFPDWR